MNARQYVIPQLLTAHDAPAPDHEPAPALDAIAWASRIAGLRARILGLSHAQLAHCLPGFDMADLMGLVVSPPYSAELQAQIARTIFPTFLADGFLRHCTRCGERWLKPAVAAELFKRVEAQLSAGEKESFLTDEEVDALLEGVTESSPQSVTATSAPTESLPEPSVPDAASANDTALETDDASQAEAANLETLANDPLRLASYIKGMPHAALKLLLVEQAFGLYDDTLANFLWFMKDGELMGKVLQRMTLHDGRLLMAKLNALWFGNNPDTASWPEKQAGQAAVNAIVRQICIINDEGRMV